MLTNFGAKRIIGFWEVFGKKIECISLYSNPNNFDDEVSVQYADKSKSGWVKVETEGTKQFIMFDGHKLYIDEIKGEDEHE